MSALHVAMFGTIVCLVIVYLFNKLLPSYFKENLSCNKFRFKFHWKLLYSSLSDHQFGKDMSFQVHSCRRLNKCRNVNIKLELEFQSFLSLQECYIHKYQTESGVELSDLGCTIPQVIIDTKIEMFRAKTTRDKNIGHIAMSPC